MATLSVFVCPGGSQVLLTDPSGAQYPGCATGQGSYQQVDVAESFDPSQLDGGELAGAFGAGFIVVGVGLCIAWACRLVFKSVWLGF